MVEVDARADVRGQLESGDGGYRGGERVAEGFAKVDLQHTEVPKEVLQLNLVSCPRHPEL